MHQIEASSLWNLSLYPHEPFLNPDNLGKPEAVFANWSVFVVRHDEHSRAHAKDARQQWNISKTSILYCEE